MDSGRTFRDKAHPSVHSAFKQNEAMGWRQWLSLTAGLFTISLFVRIICYTGLIASDDLDYARYAERVADHAYRLESHHMAIQYGGFLTSKKLRGSQIIRRGLISRLLCCSSATGS